MSIHVRDITKAFGSFKALDRVSLDVPDGTRRPGWGRPAGDADPKKKPARGPVFSLP